MFKAREGVLQKVFILGESTDKKNKEGRNLKQGRKQGNKEGSEEESKEESKQGGQEASKDGSTEASCYHSFRYLAFRLDLFDICCKLFSFQLKQSRGPNGVHLIYHSSLTAGAWADLAQTTKPISIIKTTCAKKIKKAIDHDPTQIPWHFLHKGISHFVVGQVRMSNWLQKETNKYMLFQGAKSRATKGRQCMFVCVFVVTEATLRNVCLLTLVPSCATVSNSISDVWCML